MSKFTSLYKKNGELLIFGKISKSKKIHMGIKMISCGTHHILIYKYNNDLVSFGKNSFGQLGLGDTDYRSEPTLIMNDPNIKMISCGNYHSMIYKNNGDLLVFGLNNGGQLGLNDNNNRYIPTLLMNDIRINIIRCSGYHSMIYKNNSDLFVFGYNSFGQLGLGDYENRHIPTLLSLDNNTINNLEIRLISCGSTHSMLYTYNGDLFIFGQNHCGQLGLGDFENRSKPILLMNDKEIKMIYCGSYYSMIYKNNGDLLVFGSNQYGQLGFKANDNIDIRNNNRYILMPTLLMNDINIKIIYCGRKHSIIYKNDGDLLVFGNNDNGQLGFINDKKNIYEPILIMNDPLFVKINDQPILVEWSPKNHKYFSDTFKFEVLILYKCLKRIQLLTDLKIPKFIIYEIIKCISKIID